MAITITLPAELTERNIRNKLRADLSMDSLASKGANGSKRDLSGMSSGLSSSRKDLHSSSLKETTIATRSSDVLNYVEPPLASPSSPISDTKAMLNGRVPSNSNLAQQSIGASNVSLTHLTQPSTLTASKSNLAETKSETKVATKSPSATHLSQQASMSRVSTTNASAGLATTTSIGSTKSSAQNLVARPVEPEPTPVQVSEPVRQQPQVQQKQEYVPIVKPQARREDSAETHIQGWVTELTQDRLWRRRLYAISGHDLILYTCIDNHPKEARRIHLRDLKGIKPCHDEIIVCHSVKFEFDGASEDLYFFCDNSETRNEFMSLAMAR